MGRKSSLTERQWAATVDKFDLNGLLVEARTMANSERSVTLMLRLMMAMGDLSSAIGVPAITGHRFEFSVGGGRIDLLLFHADKSMSIVEVKAENDVRIIIAGIGQLCLYAAKLPAKLHKDQQPKTIRRILCASVAPGKGADIVNACRMAGCEFAYLPPFSMFKSKMDSLYK